jgi:isopenicillin N synthase-like dioxygenase
MTVLGSPTAIASGVEDLPPEVPVAELDTIDLGKLQAGDTAEAQRLLGACLMKGVFYLDLRSAESDFLPLLERIYSISKDLFGLPLEEKCAYDVDTLSSQKCNGYAMFLFIHIVPSNTLADAMSLDTSL